MRRYFKIETPATGDNWFIAFGRDNDGKDYSLTTNFVHASELYEISGGAKQDAELVANLLNWFFNTRGADDEITAFVAKLDKDDPK